MKYTTLTPRKNGLFLILFLFFLQDHCFAQSTITTIADGDWTNANTSIWNNGGVPQPGDTVIIRHNINMQVTMFGTNPLAKINIHNGGTITISQNLILNTQLVSIEEGGAFNMNDGNINIIDSLYQQGGQVSISGGNLTIEQGNFNTNGGETTFSGGNLTIEQGNFNVSNNFSINNAIINIQNGLAFINGIFTINDNTGFYQFSNGLTVTSIGSFQINGNAIFEFSGTILNQGTFNKTGTGDVTFNNVDVITPTNTMVINGDVTVSSGDLIINTGQGITFQNNFEVNGVTVTNNSNVTINGNLSGSGTWNNNSTLNFGGNAISATLNANTLDNIVNYNANTNQTVFPTSYHNLSLSGSGTKTLTGDLTIRGDLNAGTAFNVTGSTNFTGTQQILGVGAIQLNGNITVDGTVTNNSTNLTISGNLDGAGIWRNGDNSRLDYGGTNEPMASGDLFVTNSGNTFHYSSTLATQNIKATSYYNIELSGNTNAPPGNLEINGSWTNNGTFEPGTGTVIFNGANQSISNTENFNNLTINENIDASNGLSISGALAIAANSVLSTNNTILLTNTGSIFGASMGYIDGRLRKNGVSGNFNFPIGDGDIKGSITLNGTGDFAARYFDGTPPNANGTDSQLFFISNTEYWEVESIGEETLSEMTLFWEDNLRSGITDPSDLRIARWDNANSSWINEGGTANNNSITTNNLTIDGAQVYTIGSLTGSNAIGNPPTLPTPAVLESVIPDDDNHVTITWRTEDLRYTSAYEVQRAEGSNDPDRFAPLPQGGSLENTATSFVDHSSKIANNYFYRVVAKNATAEAESNVLGLVISGLENSPLGRVTKVFPNPSQGPTQIDIANFQRTKMNWEVIDLQGRVVQRGSSDEVTSDHSYLLDFTNLSSGTYLLKVTLGDLKTVKKFVKD